MKIVNRYGLAMAIVALAGCGGTNSANNSAEMNADINGAMTYLNATTDLNATADLNATGNADFNAAGAGADTTGTTNAYGNPSTNNAM